MKTGLHSSAYEALSAKMDKVDGLQRAADEEDQEVLADELRGALQQAEDILMDLDDAEARLQRQFERAQEAGLAESDGGDSA